MHIFVFLLGSYLLGGIPFGLAIGKAFFHVDLREYGSKNIGASNAWRTFGWKIGLIVFALDLAKGLIPVIAARHYFPLNQWVIVGSGFFAILGHTASPFLGFKGGKGVATSLGVAFGLSPLGGLIGFACWLAVLGATRYISMSSVIGIACGAIATWWFNSRGMAYGIFGLVAFISAFVKHIPNFKRIGNGEEPKVSLGKKKLA